MGEEFQIENENPLSDNYRRGLFDKSHSTFKNTYNRR